mgnify:FL=1
MELTISRLGATDQPVMKELNELFAEVFDDEESYVSQPPSDKYLSEFLKSDDNIVLVAISEDTVVGGLVAYTLTKFEQECKEIYVYDLAVSTEQQRHGIGRELMKELKSIGKTAEAYVIFVHADEGDEAVKFYDSLNPDDNLSTRSFDYLI